MELTSNFDNTLLTKKIRNVITDQIMNGINRVYNNIHIHINMFGYMLEQDICLYIDTIEIHSIDGAYFEERAKLLSLENRIERYNNNKINTNLFAADLIACINERLNN